MDQDIFEDFGSEFFVLRPNPHSDTIETMVRLEDIYQAIKARLVAELMCEVDEAKRSEWSGQLMPYTRELRPLIDTTKEDK